MADKALYPSSPITDGWNAREDALGGPGNKSLPSGKVQKTLYWRPTTLTLLENTFYILHIADPAMSS